LEVANRILGLQLAALAMETIINGAGELFQGAVRQLHEMGSSGNECFSMYAVPTPVCAFPGLTRLWTWNTMAGEMINEPDFAESIRTALHNNPDLVAVYLFGSTARDQAHALSDVDVAVLFAAELSPADMFDRTLEIGVILDEALHQSVDVIALNRAPPALCFQVLKHGRLLLEQDSTQRCVFVMHALRRYYDAKPYLDYHNTQLLSRIREEGLGGGYHGHRNALAQARQLSAYLEADARGSFLGFFRPTHRRVE